MGIFGTKKNKDAAVEPKAKSEKTVKAVRAPKADKATKNIAGTVSAHDLGTIIRPRITEKSGVMSQIGVYTFEVTKGANKNTVANAIRALYKVTPVKVAILNSPSKDVFVKGRKGVVSGFKKAIVTVKKGDKIDFV